MKIRVTLKDPDTMHDAVDEAVEKYYRSAEVVGIDDEARSMLIEVDQRTQKSVISSKWMEYGEYLTVDFDTEAGTATVIENKDNR